MADRLSPKTEAALRELAREIGQARGLGEDAQEELFGHLEDKTLGYLSGEDGISEADAVLLTREHFGDAGQLANALSDTGPARVSIGIAQRLLMVTAVTLGISIVVGGLLSRSLAMLYGFDLATPIAYVVLFVQYTGAITWLTVILAAWILRAWQRRIGTAVPLNLGSRKSICLAIGFVLLLVTSLVSWSIPIYAPAPDSSIGQISRVFHGTMFWMIYASLAAWPLLWIWWMERRSGRIVMMATGLGAWLVYRLVTGTIWFHMSMTLMNGRFSGNPGPWGQIKGILAHSLAWEVPRLLLVGGAAFGLYLLYAARRDGIRVRGVMRSPQIQ